MLHRLEPNRSFLFIYLYSNTIKNISVVLGLNPSDSNVSYAPFRAPVDTALICSRINKVLKGHGLESQVMFIKLATPVVLLRENILVVPSLNLSDSNVSYGTLPCTC